MSNLIEADVLVRLQQLATIGEVSAGISHETRNLLTAIVGFAQVALQRAKTLDEAKHYFALIEREAVRCIELLERHLDASSLHREAASLGDPAALAREVAGVASSQVQLKRVALKVLEEPVPAVAMRPGDLQQVLLNLVLNALHATPAGGAITISTRARGDVVEIAVADTGPGVPVAVRDTIFDAFFTTKPDGTGLGLALCRRLLAETGGTIRLDADHVGGARFVIELPVAR